MCEGVCRGAQRCTEVCGGARRGAWRCAEVCGGVHGGAQRFFKEVVGKKSGFYVN